MAAAQRRFKVPIEITGLRLSAPTTGGSGLVAFGEASTILGSIQFALLRLLAARATEDAAQPESIRGFVRNVELIAALPWNARHPEDNHVKQQVRRLRRALERLGVLGAIEARHGLGYRLRIVVGDPAMYPSGT